MIRKFNNINKANKLITSCSKNLYFDLRPLEFLYLIFKTSSNNPKLPKLNDKY